MDMRPNLTLTRTGVWIFAPNEYTPTVGVNYLTGMTHTINM